MSVRIKQFITSTSTITIAAIIIIIFNASSLKEEASILPVGEKKSTDHRV